MKKLSKILFVICPLLFAGAGCEESNNSVDVTQEQLIGNWLEINPCDSCTVFSFTGEDKILQISTINTDTTIYSYTLLSEDTIEVIREWLEDEEGGRTEHRLNFIADETLMIPGFYISIVGIDEFRDVTLIKIN